MSEIIGIDYGEKYIGIARVNSEVALAEPLQTFSGEFTDLLAVLVDYIEEFSTTKIVVGLPRGLDGQATEQTEVCVNFARSLSADLSNIEVFLVDEAGTSQEAIFRKNVGSKAGIDSIAAAILLEDFLTLSSDQQESSNIKNYIKR